MSEERAESRGVRQVIFDMGGVVLDWNPDAILERLWPVPADRPAIKAALFEHPDWLELDRGTLGEAELLARFRARLPQAEPACQGLFEIVCESLKPKAATLALMTRLVERRVPLYCLSNMPLNIYDELRQRHDFWRLFAGVVISAEVRMVKPDRAIFEHLLRRYDLAPEETVFIDDLPRNIESARALGFETLLFRDAAQCERELTRLLN